MNCSNSVLLVRMVLALGLVAALPLRATELTHADSAKLVLENARKDALHPHGLLGKVDSVNAVTLDQIAQMGMKEARKRYVGKIVTFKGLIPVGVSAKNEHRKNVCMQGFIERFPPGKYYLNNNSQDSNARSCEGGSVRVYFNFGDEVERWIDDIPYNPKDLRLDHPLIVPFDVCDTLRPSLCQEGDIEYERKCIFSTERLLIAGKVMAIDQDKRGVRFSFEIRPTGLRY